MEFESIRDIFLKYILLPLIMLITIFIMGVVKKNVPIKLKHVIIYILLAGLSMGVVGFLGFTGIHYNPYWYMASQLIFIGLGVLHVNLLHKYFSKHFVKEIACMAFEIFLTIAVLCFGALVFYLIFGWISKGIGNPYFSATSLLAFAIPLLFYYAYVSFLKIPFSIYKTWQYEAGKEPFDLSQKDFDKLMVLRIELSKRSENDERFIINAKTLPSQITFGEWFHRVITDYNFKNPNDPIQLQNEQHESFFWIFYIKKSFFLPRQYIDFDKDVTENGISENDVIICKRVINYLEEGSEKNMNITEIV